MNKTQQNILSLLQQHIVFTLVLGLTLAYFLYRGIAYALLGSYIPLLLIATIIVLLVLTSRKSETAFKRTLGVWTLLVLVWSAVRLLLSITHHLIHPVPESHIAEQMGIRDAILSGLFLLAAVYIGRYKKRIGIKIKPTENMV